MYYQLSDYFTNIQVTPSSGYDRWHRWPVSFLGSSRHWRLLASHIHTHTHAHARTRTDAVTSRGLLKWNRLDWPRGLLFHDQWFPLVCVWHILHMVLRRWENHKTFILTMTLNKDYRHPRKFCIFWAKFVSLGPSIWIRQRTTIIKY